METKNIINLKSIISKALKIFYLLLIIPIFCLYLFRTGIYSLSANQIISFYSNNINDFNLIADYASKKIFDSPEVLIAENGEFKATYKFNDIFEIIDIGNDLVSNSMKKILLFGNYDYIFFSSNERLIEFRTSNLIIKPEEAIAIIYSEKEVFDYTEIDNISGDITYKTVYQDLGDNWYYVYREI